MLAETWGGVVDTVGGDILFNGVKSLRYGCSLAACGLVAAPTFGASVLPFILRHVNLLGIDSVQLPIDQKAAIWQRLATDWQMDLSALEEVLTLETLSDAIDRIWQVRWWGEGYSTYSNARREWFSPAAGLDLPRLGWGIENNQVTVDKQRQNGSGLLQHRRALRAVKTRSRPYDTEENSDAWPKRKPTSLTLLKVSTLHVEQTPKGPEAIRRMMAARSRSASIRWKGPED